MKYGVDTESDVRYLEGLKKNRRAMKVSDCMPWLVEGHVTNRPNNNSRHRGLIELGPDSDRGNHRQHRERYHSLDKRTDCVAIQACEEVLAEVDSDAAAMPPGPLI